MLENLIQQLERLVEEGTKLTPLGGFDFSGYNLRMQERYLAWRKACLQTLERVGPIGSPYKSKILGDANGGFFYQSSAYLTLLSVRELVEKLKASPELAGEIDAPPPAPLQQQPVEAPPPPTGNVRTLKPPPKPAGVPAAAPVHSTGDLKTLKPPPILAGGPIPGPFDQKVPAPAPAVAAPKSAYVVGENNDSLRQQLSMFLDEIGIKEIPLDRSRGEMLALEAVPDNPDAKFAFFIFNSEDLAYAMFELGHFVGKLGKGRVVVLHMTDVDVPKNIPGVLTKPIVVKLEEASLSIMKELKGAGYVISL